MISRRIRAAAAAAAASVTLLSITHQLSLSLNHSTQRATTITWCYRKRRHLAASFKADQLAVGPRSGHWSISAG